MKAIRRIVLIVGCIFATCVACENKRLASQLDEIESYIIQHPDSALAELRSIDSSDLNSQSLRAHYSLLYAMALDKNYIDTADVSVIQPAIEYYEGHGSVDQKLRSYYYLGRIYHNAKNNTDAMLFYTKALDLLEQSDDYHFKILVHGILSNMYSGRYMADKAVLHAKKAYDYAVISGDKRAEWIFQGYMSVCCGDTGNKSKADSLFQQYMAKPVIDSTVFARNMFYYAKMLLARSPAEPERCIEIFNLAKNQYKGKPTIDSYYYYAYALEACGKRKESEQLLEKLNSLKNGSLAAESWLYAIQRHRGNYKEALALFEKTVKGQDSIIISNLRQSYYEVQKEYYSEKFAKTEESRRADKYLFTTICLTLSIAILIVFIIMYYLRQRWLNRLETMNVLKDEADEKLHLYSEQISSQEEILTSLQRKYIASYKDQYQLLSHLCTSYLSPSGNKPNRVYNEVKEILEKIADDNMFPSKAETMVDKELDGIMSVIRKDFPSFSEKDYRFISFAIMGFEAKAIALLMNYSVKTVYVKKERYKTKISRSDSQHKKQILSYLA